ncbi:hypothetical protein CVV26_02365 [Candidatus Kuenenbacteria bacterium HGW-Kuenenbacteria-1]|uniref:Isopropylmalate dehydrogenase-like domain-containing protein n=1 Tax=Candidatus Kuenenbacteria bacterium HGW-Kuenenbacteria-1 TaxID=2013812 RepID=A0A2N1UN82_9BACT|nr:MAG: hypothetical protein CVV26_02365 [Candidatus Kuenenbacteria bacterium HGW-Kuenenbacteria-1]
MRKIQIALVEGDGSAPEIMREATKIVIEAAKMDNIKIEFVLTPIGWNAYEKYGDTFPAESFQKASELKLLFFGGVGDPKFDTTLGKENPSLMPEVRALLTIRKEWGLLLNFRPIIYFKSLDHLVNVRPETIPDKGIEQVWIRFLLEDSYFGNADLKDKISAKERMILGIKEKAEVTGEEEIITDLSYYRKETIEKYLRAAFAYAEKKGLPLISIDKANAISRYKYWREICTRITKEFPNVPCTHQLVDSANALLFTPAKLHGVIVCGNEHGDILSDGAASALGSMGLMCGSAINPDTGAAMFESGAGTAPLLTGKDVVNPIGRILTGAMMLRHVGAEKGAEAIEKAVYKFLIDGNRTLDLASQNDSLEKIVGTKKTSEIILNFLKSNK